jgi:hypothetical protein
MSRFANRAIYVTGGTGIRPTPVIDLRAILSE